MNGNLFNNNFLLGFAFLGQDFEDQQDKLEIALTASQLRPGFNPGIIALKQRVDSHVEVIDQLNTRTNERDALRQQVAFLSESNLNKIVETVKKQACGPDRLKMDEASLEKIGLSREQIAQIHEDNGPLHQLLSEICDVVNPPQIP